MDQCVAQRDTSVSGECKMNAARLVSRRVNEGPRMYNDALRSSKCIYFQSLAILGTSLLKAICVMWRVEAYTMLVTYVWAPRYCCAKAQTCSGLQSAETFMIM